MTFLRVAAVAALIVSEAPAAPVVLWHVEGQGRGTPSADDTSVYCVSKYHEVFAFDAKTGRERWRNSTHEIDPETYGYTSVVAGSVVAVGDYNLIAFDRASGEQRWKFEPADGYAAGIYLGTEAAGAILTGSPAGRLYAVNQETGTERWSATIEDDGNTTVFYPVTDGSIVVAGFTQFVAPLRGGVAAVDLETGKVRWKVPFPLPSDKMLGTNWAGGPVLVDDLALVSSGEGVIYAFDRLTGAIRWSIPRVDHVPPGNPIISDHDFRALTVSGRTLISGSLTGVVIAYDLDTRRERWRFDSNMSGSTSFKIASDREVVYLPYFGGELIALDVNTGAERWRIGDWKVGFLWAPVVWNDRVFLSTYGDGYYALSAGPVTSSARGLR